jgi:hypothetical protein
LRSKQNVLKEIYKEKKKIAAKAFIKAKNERSVGQNMFKNKLCAAIQNVKGSTGNTEKKIIKNTKAGKT